MLYLLDNTCRLLCSTSAAFYLCAIRWLRLGCIVCWESVVVWNLPPVSLEALAAVHFKLINYSSNTTSEKKHVHCILKFQPTTSTWHLTDQARISLSILLKDPPPPLFPFSFQHSQPSAKSRSIKGNQIQFPPPPTHSTAVHKPGQKCPRQSEHDSDIVSSVTSHVLIS